MNTFRRVYDEPFTDRHVGFTITIEEVMDTPDIWFLIAHYNERADAAFNNHDLWRGGYSHLNRRH